MLFAVGRELLANVRKHAGADRVSVEVDRRGDVLWLRVADDGCGFDDERRRAALRAGHIGLASCAERLDAAGGGMTVHTRPGGGTAVEATVPLRAEAATAPGALAGLPVDVVEARDAADRAGRLGRADRCRRIAPADAAQRLSRGFVAARGFVR